LLPHFFPTQINFKLDTKFFSLSRGYFATIVKAKEPNQNQRPSYSYKKQSKRNIYITFEMLSNLLKMLENYYSTIVASSNVNVQFPFTFLYMILYIVFLKIS
jgi:hypothetical protein